MATNDYNATDAYRAGWQAYGRQKVKENPFTMHSEFYRPWEDGYHSAQNSGWIKGKYDRSDVPCDKGSATNRKDER